MPFAIALAPGTAVRTGPMRFLVIASICVACGGGTRTQKPATLSATWTAPSMFAKVPADSPYLVAALDPMPELVRRQSFAAIDEKIAAGLAQMEAEPAIDRATLPPEQRMMYAFLDEVKGKSLERWGRELGFDPSGRFVLYGLSVWPVLRVAVSNEVRLREVIAHVVAASGAPVVQRSLDGRAYWQWTKNDIAVIASVVGGEAVFAVLPAPAVGEYLPIVLGVKQPRHTLADDDRLGALTARHHFLPTMVGYIDAKIVADILTQRAPSASTELDRPLRSALGPIEPTCRTDIDRLVAVAPRIVWGYHRLDARGMDASFVIETPPAIAAALEPLRTVVPEVGADAAKPALFRLGIAAKLDELLPLLRRLTDHVRERPFACSWFLPLNGAAARLAGLLDRPLPPMLGGLRGFSLSLDDMTREPFDMRGHAVAVGDHAGDLIATMLHALPGMSGAAVVPDGRPVQLPLALLGMAASTTGYAAMRVDRAAIAIGPTSANDVTRVLDLPLPAHSPLLAFGMDFQRMLALGLVKPEDSSGMGDITMQLDVGPQGLVFELIGNYPAR